MKAGVRGFLAGAGVGVAGGYGQSVTFTGCRLKDLEQNQGGLFNYAVFIGGAHQATPDNFIEPGTAAGSGGNNGNLLGKVKGGSGGVSIDFTGITVTNAKPE